MRVFKIDITAWTSSFKYPNLISGFQPTLEVPPLSTVLGLINASAGRYIKHGQLRIGYYFEFRYKAIDVETIYQIANEKGYPDHSAKSNVINREFLYDNHLIIYVQDREIVEYFRAPVYSLLLGRSGDLATVNSIREVELSETSSADRISGQIVPFNDNYLPGLIQPLSKYFSDTIPRTNLGTEPYSVISCKAFSGLTKLPAGIDYPSKEEVHIYFHELDFSSFYE
jgi:CRISPR-associated protein Cas5t